MSKRKQMRPSKFDGTKKGDDQSQMIVKSADPNSPPPDSGDDQQGESGESSLQQADPIEHQSSASSSSSNDSSMEKTIASVARGAASTTSVIVRRSAGSRKRIFSSTIGTSVADNSPNCCGGGIRVEKEEADDDAEHETDEEHDHENGGRPGAGSSPPNSQQHDFHPLEKNRKRSRLSPAPPILKHQPAVSACNDLSLDPRQFTKSLFCPYCETRFSNPNTLEAHRTIYCTKRPMVTNLAPPNLVPVIRVPASRSLSIDAPLPPPPPTPIVTSSSFNNASQQRPHQQMSNIAPPSNCLSLSSLSHHQTPSVILLPCAYTNNGSNAIQIIGKPQTIVPVAIPVSTYLPTGEFHVSPLLLEESWCAGIDMSDGATVSISAAASPPPQSMNGGYGSSKSKSSTFVLPLAIRGSAPTCECGRRAVVSSRTTTDRQKSRSPPLDLTKKTLSSPRTESGAAGIAAAAERRTDGCSSTAASANDNPNTSINDPEFSPPPPQSSSSSNVVQYQKNFACSKCGVAFSSKKTLEGHQAYYCKATAAAAPKSSAMPPCLPPNYSVATTSENGGHQQTLCCQYCDQAATTAWQLVQHMKTVHSLGAAYLCTLCGYRGFSMRGMKSHLKHAHANEASTSTATNVPNFEEVCLSKYIKRTELFAEDDDEHGVEEDRVGETDDMSKTSNEDASQEMTTTTTEVAVKREKGEEDIENGGGSMNGEKTDNGSHNHPNRSAPTSPTCPTLLSKYACQFCSYKSPYKGNVKRHLALVHKIEKQKG